MTATKDHENIVKRQQDIEKGESFKGMLSKKSQDIQVRGEGVGSRRGKKGVCEGGRKEGREEGKKGRQGWDAREGRKELGCWTSDTRGEW